MEIPSILLKNSLGGDFLKKHIKRIVFLGVMAAAVWFGGILADSQALTEDILRLHVVANSDSQEDQAVKLRVRDAVLATLEEGLADLQDADQAVEYVKTMVPKLTQVANQVLEQAGFSEQAQVSVGEEAFPVREYDTFSLPSGIYKSLRIVIGNGEGHNWWCVVFPELCGSATSEEFAEVANMEGMSDSLSGSLTGEYEIRFWVLDQIGKVRNFLHGDSE